MKKILLMAMAAAAMVSCSQNEEIENISKNAEVKFGAVVKAGTKAVVTTTSNLTSFGAIGYKTTEAMGAGVTLTDYTGKVTVTGSGDTWTADKTIYWPAGNLQFFATSPVQTLAASTGYPTFNYTVGAIGDQKDLIAANVINATKAAPSITFAFQHLLTQVNFSIAGDLLGCVYNVTKLELVDVNSAAKFTFDGASTVGSWSAQATPATYSWTGTASVTPTAGLSNTTKILVTDNNALFMLMPQTLGSTTTLKVTYTATPAGMTEASFSGTKEIALTGAWAMSKNVHYTLKLSSDATAITYGKPSVGGWTDSSSDLTPANP